MNVASYPQQSSVYPVNFASDSTISLSQRVEFGKSNSAFMPPVKEDEHVTDDSVYTTKNYSNNNLSSTSALEFMNSQQIHNENEELVINELLKIMESSNSQPCVGGRPLPPYGSTQSERARSMSVSIVY